MEVGIAYPSFDVKKKMPEDVRNRNMITVHVSRKFQRYFLDIFSPMYKMHPYSCPIKGIS